MLGKEGRDLGADSAEGLVLVDQHGAMGLGHGVEDGLLVERTDGAEIDDLGLDAVLGGQDLGRREAGQHRATVGDEGDIDSFALHVGNPERDRVGAVGNLTEVSVEESILHEADGVVVADGGDHEPLGIIGSGWADNLEPGGVGQEVLRGVGVGRADVGAAVGGAADDHRDIDETARHVADAAGVVDDLVEADVGETPEHEFDHGAETHHGGTHTHAEKGGLADRGIDDSLRSEAIPESLGHLVGAVVLRDLLTHEEDILVAGKLLGEGLVEGLAVSDDGHAGKEFSGLGFRLLG